MPISTHTNPRRPYFLLLVITVAIHGCGKSEEEVNILLEDTYNEGWWDALDCVKRKGGSAHAAADECEDE